MAIWPTTDRHAARTGAIDLPEKGDSATPTTSASGSLAYSRFRKGIQSSGYGPESIRTDPCRLTDPTLALVGFGKAQPLVATDGSTSMADFNQCIMWSGS